MLPFHFQNTTIEILNKNPLEPLPSVTIKVHTKCTQAVH